MFGQYAPLAGAYDELLTDSKAVRGHAEPFVDSINKIGPDELAYRWEVAQRLVHENGFAYSGNITTNDQPRPWELDALPLPISPDDWQKVSAALKQRATVLNLVLRDIYGEQTLLKRGILPRELVFSHPGFLRSYHGQKPPHDCFLHFYAADLARSPDGGWWILADRTEAPSGVGYALENRIVISRMLPDVFDRCNVERLASFFIAAQETLRDLAPRRRENPRVVLLSHGPTSPNYFEDAYLARYLGYTLVEGGDLAVRNSQVLLKTLGGLLPVDVIFRRQNSEDCDSLELNPSSRLGVAGLTQAVRAGQVAVANALGSGLVESAAFMSFMPQLCKALLGEELLAPGVATWWCGQPTALEYVLKHLDRLIIQPAFRSRGKDGPTRQSLGDMPLDKLADTIRANPIRFAAQEKVVRSSAPAWGGKLQSAHVALRAYLAATDDTYTVMPGALARISSALDPLELSIRRGERSKDAWVIAAGPVAHVTLLDEPGQPIELRRTGAELPSRVADNIFWLGRQLERAESYARLLRITARRLSGETRSSSDLEVPVLLRCLADQGQIEPGYVVDEMKELLPMIDRVLPISVLDKSNSGSLRCVLDEIFRLGSIVRDRMSLDTLRIMQRIDDGFQPPRRGTPSLSDLLAMTDDLIIELAAFSGVVTESMTRTQAYRFLELGRRLERAEHIIALVKTSFIPLPKVQGPLIETVLDIADSLMTYRSRYLANLQLAAVLDLLLTDETNPRSLAYQILQLNEHVELLPRKKNLPGYSSEQRLAMSLLHKVRMLDVRSMANDHSIGEYHHLEKLAEDLKAQLPKLAEAISHRYLVHAGPAHQLAAIRPQ